MPKKEVFIIMPNPDVYYGVKIDKDTKLEFENKYIKQTVEDLKLKSVYIKETDEFKSTVNTEIYLKEGAILLLEEEERGYFLPKNISIGTIEQGIEEMNFLKEQISKIKE